MTYALNILSWLLRGHPLPTIIKEKTEAQESQTSGSLITFYWHMHIDGVDIYPVWAPWFTVIQAQSTVWKKKRCLVRGLWAALENKDVSSVEVKE